MAGEFEQHPEDFKIYELDDYLNLMKEILERLNPAFVVERIAGEVPPPLCVNQPWSLRYDQVLQRFEALLEEHGTWQGKLFTI